MVPSRHPSASRIRKRLTGEGIALSLKAGYEQKTGQIRSDRKNVLPVFYNSYMLTMKSGGYHAGLPG
jgi:hypothetical protein